MDWFLAAFGRKKVASDLQKSNSQTRDISNAGTVFRRLLFTTTSGKQSILLY